MQGNWIGTDMSGTVDLGNGNPNFGLWGVNAQGFNANFAGAVSAPPNGTATANGALIPVTALAAQDLFSRPDQNGIGTASDGHAWAADYNVYPAAQVSISTGNLYIQTATQNTDHDTWMGIPYRDEEITADLYIVNVFQDPRFLHGGRLLARVQGSDSWIVMALNTVNDTLTIWVDNGGNWAQLGSASVQMSPNTWYHAKLDVVGSVGLSVPRSRMTPPLPGSPSYRKAWETLPAVSEYPPTCPASLMA